MDDAIIALMPWRVTFFSLAGRLSLNFPAISIIFCGCLGISREEMRAATKRRKYGRRSTPTAPRWMSCLLSFDWVQLNSSSTTTTTTYSCEIDPKSCIPSASYSPTMWKKLAAVFCFVNAGNGCYLASFTATNHIELSSDRAHRRSSNRYILLTISHKYLFYSRI